MLYKLPQTIDRITYLGGCTDSYAFVPKVETKNHYPAFSLNTTCASENKKVNLGIKFK